MDAEEVKAWLARDKNKKKDTRRIHSPVKTTRDFKK